VRTTTHTAFLFDCVNVRQTDRQAGREEVLHRYHIYVLFTHLKRALSYPLLTSLKRIGVVTLKIWQPYSKVRLPNAREFFHTMSISKIPIFFYSTNVYNLRHELRFSHKYISQIADKYASIA